ncbi:MAG: endopeptidase La [Lachnospira sp.]|nr:endopeptidase La [Lachnospira sp.]
MKKKILPTIALRSMTVLPDMVIHFDISRKKSLKAVERAMEENQQLFLVTQLDPEVAEPTYKDMHVIGTVATIKQLIKMPEGIVRVLVEGVSRAVVSSMREDRGCLVTEVIISEQRFNDIDKLTSRAMVQGLQELVRQYAAANPKMNHDVIKQWLEIEDAGKLLERIAVDYPMSYKKRQHFLEVYDVNVMYEEIARMILEDINISQIQLELSDKVKEKVDKNQNDYILREQMKVLAEELDGEDSLSETEEFNQKVDELVASEEIKDSIRKEIKRYKTLSKGSSEAHVERGYIETLLSLPWDKETEDNNDLNVAETVLERDHYGMEKIKKRILEALAVRNIADASDAPIICLVGPPGTGKTSIARSVAEALNKEYVRICLGGVRDEAEIRGHRKTYVGAMPGRIIAALKKAQVKNPLMLLDEIDKISNDYRSDTASALLEVLDSEQNKHFVDHYVELPTDLSKVLFIATANDLSGVSRPLLDRMEIIEVSSYTKNEKMHIAKDHLVPKQIKKNGLLKKHVKFSDKALNAMIDGYTKEAGVRSLERQIAAVCRKVVKELYDNGALKDVTKPISITDKNLEDYLGKVKYKTDSVNKKAEVGIVRGLAWTSVGGDTLEIEVNTMPGKGELILTGKMGDVMKESARIALSYVRSIASGKKYKVSEEFFEKNNIHIHIPEGAVPKDGPSAGITMATAILSAVANIKVRADVAMTGEINLRGRVLKIGGLKEKMLAAKTAGVKLVLVPKDNEPDVKEFDEEITSGIDIIYVKDMAQVLECAFTE